MPRWLTTSTGGMVRYSTIGALVPERDSEGQWVIRAHAGPTTFVLVGRYPTQLDAEAQCEAIARTVVDDV